MYIFWCLHGTALKMPTIVGILTFMSRKNVMFNGVEHDKIFITSGSAFVSLTVLHVKRIFFAAPFVT